jgi:hypothetical protein
MSLSIRFIACAYTLAAVGLTTPVFAQTDNFDDGNDDGWTHTDPLADELVGAPPGSYSFPATDPGHAYRMNRGESPSPEEFGNSRIGSYREDVRYTDFRIAVDVVDYDDSIDQDIGILARIFDVGFGETSGYALTYDTSEDAIYLSLLDFEAASDIGTVSVGLADPAAGFRIELIGRGDEFTAYVYELDNLDEPITELEAFCDTHAEGFGGIFVATARGEDGADATFDNYRASDPDAPAPQTPLEIKAVEVTADVLSIQFSADHALTYSLESSPDLVQWQEVADAHNEIDPETGRFEVPVDPSGTFYYRITQS